MATDLFDGFRNALMDKPVTHIWRGHGSALFVEIGALKELTREGRHPRLRLQGDYTIMIEWSWRVENATSILCGSWSDEELWQPTFDSLLHRSVVGLDVWGRLPELIADLSGEMRIMSFMTADGQPSWTIFDNSPSNGISRRWLSVKDGKIVVETSPD